VLAITNSAGDASCRPKHDNPLNRLEFMPLARPLRYPSRPRTTTREIEMEVQPQIAFHQWLIESLTRALSRFSADEAHVAHLAQSIDHADLKRRMYMHELFR
jgi:hypothetical protein